MSALRQSLADYLSLRRSLGYSLQRPEKLLGQFIDYLDACGASTVTAEHALAWARLPESSRPVVVGASPHRRSRVRRLPARSRRSQ